jgi:hypothetical protein
MQPPAVVGAAAAAALPPIPFLSYLYGLRIAAKGNGAAIREGANLLKERNSMRKTTWPIAPLLPSQAQARVKQ